MSAISQINLNHLILIALIKYRESFLSDYWRSDLRTQHLSFLPWNSIIFWWIGKKKKSKKQAGTAGKVNTNNTQKFLTDTIGF